MAQISDNIESFIKDMMEQDNEIELKRNELAQHFGCAPSQINYVLSTRFTVQHGYIIESRRGGGGFIRIVRVRLPDEEQLLEQLMSTIGQSISEDGACAMIGRLLDGKVITQRESLLMRSAMQDSSVGLPVRAKDVLRAATLRAMIMQVFRMQAVKR